jgi:thymidylate synthase
MPKLPAPKLIVDKSITNFYDFTVDSFKLEDYKCNEKKYDIPVAE